MTINTPFNENAFTQEEKEDPDYEYVEIIGFEPERTINYFVICIVYNNFTPEISSRRVTEHYYLQFQRKHGLLEIDDIPNSSFKVIEEEKKKHIYTEDKRYRKNCMFNRRI